MKAPAPPASYREYVRNSVSEDRWEHTQGVMEISQRLLANYPRLPGEDLMSAGLLHDNAKDLPAQEQYERALEYRGNMDEIEDQFMELWHAPAGAQRIIDDLGFEGDHPVTHAVAFHPTGHAPMDRVLKGLMIADFAEFTRSYPEAEDVRNAIGTRSLDELIIRVLQEKIARCVHKGWPLHPWSLEAYNSLCLDQP